MNDKEIAEIRRRFRPDRTNITHVRGCYVNASREIVTTFDHSLALAGELEQEQYLALLKRVLSGAQGKNLLDISFRTAQVADSDEHRLLSSLRDTALGDEAVLDTFYRLVAQSLQLETGYVILLAHDVYDVPYRGRDGGGLEDASENQFSYVVCSICPVKPMKPKLRYDGGDFCLQAADVVMAAPELGFLFPAFDGRSTNLYNALCYTRSAADVHEDFIQAVFRTEPPMAADDQRETFQSLLSGALDEQCSYGVIQEVHGQLCGLIAEHKASREPEPLALTKQQVEGLLAQCGVAEPELAKFDAQFDEQFGADAVLPPANIVDPSRLQLNTPDVTIRVNPERGDLVETRVLDGARYILIRADEAVEVNGVSIRIAGDDRPE